MSVIHFFHTKGGVHCSTVATLTALSAPTLLIDLQGDIPAILGTYITDESTAETVLATGVSWWAAAHAVTDTLYVMSRAERGPVPLALDVEVAAMQVPDGMNVVVDWGMHAPRGLTRRLLVTSPSYLAIRSAMPNVADVDGIVVSGRHPGSSLGASDVSHALGKPVVAEIDFDPQLARSIDAGLLVSRTPRVPERALQHLLNPRMETTS